MRYFKPQCRLVPTAAGDIEFGAPIAAYAKGEDGILNKPQGVRDTARNDNGAPVFRPPIDRNAATEGGRLATDVVQSEQAASSKERVVFVIVDVHMHTANDAVFRDAGIPLHGRKSAGPFGAINFVEATTRVRIGFGRHDGTILDRERGCVLESNHVRIGSGLTVS